MEDHTRNLDLNFKGRRILVTGGFGYVGNAIVRALVRHGAELVAIFDLKRSPLDLAPDPETEALLKSKTVEILGDIRNFSSFIKKPLAGLRLDTVVHVASFGMSGIDMLTKSLIHDVNVGGTAAVLEACIELGIENMVYTSSYNAVFYGQRISNEVDLPYPLLEKHVDEPLKSGGRLRTVAVRPAAIYGPAEMRHFPRLIHTMRMGLLKFTVGDEKDLVEWVYIDNLVYGHLCAAQKIQDEPSRVAGKAYPIADQKPINNWLFFKPLFDGLGYWYPTIKFPAGPTFYFAYFLELVNLMLSKVGIRYEPFMARAEVVKIGVEHYFNHVKVQKELGYYPIVKAGDGIRYTVDYFKKGEEVWQRGNAWKYLLGHYLVFAFLGLLLVWAFLRLIL